MLKLVLMSSGEFGVRSMINRYLAGMVDHAPETGRHGNPADRMVSRQIEARGIHDSRVLAALRAVPRDLFIPESCRGDAWADRALPIGRGQTISQPYIVALMTSILNPSAGDRILEVGTGSGYQAAVLASMGALVDTVEIIPALAREAADRLALLGYSNVMVHTGDGSEALSGKAPYDGIMITCATSRIPEDLEEALVIGGRIVAPIGKSLSRQDLTVATRGPDGALTLEKISAVVFVPMTGPRGLTSSGEALA